MDNYQDETTFEVTVTSDGVSTSGISSPQIVLDTSNTNTLSWGINECSSSFQSVSSCETLESYEPVNTESPKVIVVPFLADNQVTGTMIANNGVHIPLIKECSIRIDPLKMTSTHSDVINVERIIELPFSTDAPSDCSTKTPTFMPNDDDSSPFLGFEVESINGTLCEMYRKAARLIKENAVRVANDSSRYSNDPIVIDRDSSEPILTERILTERHFMGRQPTERNIKTETVKRTRPIQLKMGKSQLSGDQFAPQNQSRTAATVNTEVKQSPSPRKQNNCVKPVVATPERVAFIPVQNVDGKNNKPSNVSDSSGSDSDVIPIPSTPTVPVNSSATKRSLERSAGIKNENKEKELKRLEKLRRRKELSWIAERIHEQWKERIDAIKRKQRKKEARKRKLENRRSHSTKYENCKRKRKRVSYSSDTDSTDSSSSSRTSCSSSSSDSDSNDSDPDTYTSDTSYTSQTTHTRTESDSTDTDSSDHRYRRRLKRYRRSPSETSDTSETSSSSDDVDGDDDDDEEPGRYVKRRKIQSTKRAHRKPSRYDENCVSARKRRSSESHRSEELLHQKHREMRRSLDVEDEQPKRMKSPSIIKRKQQKFDVPSTSSAATMRKFPKFGDRSVLESTSAGDFLVK